MIRPVAILIIAGPTACGKTRMAIETAQLCNGEIIGADSRQLYKHLDIATAKPTTEEREQVPHHLVDFIEPDQDYDVADYVRDASRIIKELDTAGKVPIVCGGSGLYIRRLVEGIFSSPGIQKDVRMKLRKQAESRGTEYLHEQLKEIDPETAARVHHRDRVRIIRALEVYHTSGYPISDLQKHKTEPCVELRPLYFVLTKTRENLYRDINERIDRMLVQGLIWEVEKIMEMGYDFSLKSLSGLGYCDIAAALQNKIPMDTAINNLKRDTRRYAKRQLTWFRKDKNAIWYNVDTETEFRSARKKIIAEWQKFNENTTRTSSRKSGTGGIETASDSPE